MIFWLRLLCAAVVGAVLRFAYRLVAFAGSFLALGVVLVVVGSLIARAVVPFAEARLDERWAESLDALFSLPERVIPHGANRAALEL